jgi:hypothetical protein
MNPSDEALLLSFPFSVKERKRIRLIQQTTSMDSGNASAMNGENLASSRTSK